MPEKCLKNWWQPVFWGQLVVVHGCPSWGSKNQTKLDLWTLVGMIKRQGIFNLQGRWGQQSGWEWCWAEPTMDIAAWESGGLYTPPPILIGIRGIPRTVLGFRSEFTRIFFGWVSCQFGILSLSKFLVSSDWNARSFLAWSPAKLAIPSPS